MTDYNCVKFTYRASDLSDSMIEEYVYALEDNGYSCWRGLDDGEVRRYVMRDMNEEVYQNNIFIEHYYNEQMVVISVYSLNRAEVAG